MIRKTVAMISLVIMMMSVSSFAEVSQYEIKDRFTPTGLYMLYGNNMVSETWPDRDGRTDQGWYVTWFQDRKILREVAYDPDGKYRYYAAPHKDGTCSILRMELPDAANMADEKRYSNLILYDWDENGLSNPRQIANNIKEIRVAFGGFATWNPNAREIGIFDGSGSKLFILQNAESKPIRLAFDQLGNIWVMTAVYGEQYKDSRYYLRQIRNGTLLWEKKLDWAVSIFPDQQGGLYTTESLGTGSYKDVGITHLNADGKEDMRKTLTANKVVIGCTICPDPQNGQIIVTGRAVANSRKIYRVYRMTLDTDWNIKSIDVRKLNYHNDYNLSVRMSLDGICFVHANGIDEQERGDIHPVLIPFDELEAAENPGIALR